MIDVYVKLPTITPQMQKALSSRCFRNGMIEGNKEIGGDLVDTAKAGILASPKTYRVYYVNGKRTRSSQPGAYPANQTGRLRKSIHSETSGLDMRFGAGTDAPFSVYLQNDSPLKTPVWKKVAPRPFLTLAHRKVRPKMEKIMLTSVLRNIGQ